MSNELRWHWHFLSIAEECASMSKDPSTQVGAVIVGPDKEIRSTGFNGFPRGIADTDERLNNRETKLKLVVHAEMNAILNAARFGVPLKGCTLYLAAMNGNLVWGGPPCSRCTVEVIQSGISSIISYPKKAVPSRWHDDLIVAESLLEEAGVGYREIPNRVKDYEFLLPQFLDAMNDIMRYGFEKYGDASFHAKRLLGDRTRDLRLNAQTIADHAREHFSQYLNHIQHDKFNDDIHQLAASAIGPMMEAYLAGLDVK